MEQAVQAHTLANAELSTIIENEAVGFDNESVQQYAQKVLLDSINHPDNEETKLVFGNLSSEQKEKFVSERIQEVMRDLTKYIIQIPRVTFHRPPSEPIFNTAFRIDPSFLQ